MEMNKEDEEGDEEGIGVDIMSHIVIEVDEMEQDRCGEEMGGYR